MKKALTLFTALTLLLSALPAAAVETTVSACPTITRALSQGSTGKDVSALQTFLARTPSIYPEGMVTGYFGVATKAALQRWQDAQGIVSPTEQGSGIVGSRTRAALLRCGATQTGSVSTKTLPASPDLTCNIGVKPGFIRQGEKAVVSWTVTGAVKNGVLIPGQSTIRPVASTTVTPSVTTTYVASFEGPPGYKIACQVPLYVYTASGAPTSNTTPAASSTAAVVPAIRFFGSDASIVQVGKSALLTWEARGASACGITAKPLSGGDAAVLLDSSQGTTSGSLSIIVSQAASYTLACSTPTGERGPIARAVLSIGTATSGGINPVFPYLSLTANGFDSSVTLARGGTATLQWSARNVREFSCSIRSDSGMGALISTGESGATSVGPLSTSTSYRLSCLDVSGVQVIDDVRVNIQ